MIHKFAVLGKKHDEPHGICGIWAVFGYRLTRRPRRVVKFFCCILGYCARNNSVIVRRGGWGAANNHSCDATLEMGCGGVGLITSKNVPWHLQTHVLLR